MMPTISMEVDNSDDNVEWTPYMDAHLLFVLNGRRLCGLTQGSSLVSAWQKFNASSGCTLTLDAVKNRLKEFYCVENITELDIPFETEKQINFRLPISYKEMLASKISDYFNSEPSSESESTSSTDHPPQKETKTSSRKSQGYNTRRIRVAKRTDKTEK